MTSAVTLPGSRACSSLVTDGIYLLGAPPPYSFVSKTACPKLPGARVIRFVPSTGAVETLGAAPCPKEEAALMSLAIDRRGTLYALPNDWGHPMYRLGIGPDRCDSLGPAFGKNAYAALQGGLTFVGDSDGNGESLYFAVNGKSPADFEDERVGRIDPVKMTFAEIAGLQAAFLLAGTPGGELYGLHPFVPRSLVRFDTRTGKIGDTWKLGEEVEGAHAFAAWRGDFYLFVAYGGPHLTPARRERIPSRPDAPHGIPGDGTCEGTTVLRYHLGDREAVEVAHIDGLDVRAAAASTCRLP